MFRVQSVSFDRRVTVYPADDYDRRSPWMYIARRRQQFRLGIQQMELILAPILDDEHRLNIRTRHLAFCRYCVWQCELDYMYIVLCVLTMKDERYSLESFNTRTHIQTAARHTETVLADFGSNAAASAATGLC